MPQQNPPSSIQNHGSTSNTTGSTNKYGATYHTIRQLIQEEVSPALDHATTTTTMMLRNDMARLDELRRILCGCWMEYHHQLGRRRRNSSSSAAMEKWVTFLRNSRATLVNQLCQRIEMHRSYRIRLLASRTLWGVIAGTPVAVTRPDDDGGGGGGGDNDDDDIAPILTMDVQLLQRFVRAIAGTADLVVEEEKESNKESNDSDGNENDPNEKEIAWMLRSNDVENKQLHQFLCNECLQPYRDVQYYVMSSIHTVCNELYTTATPSNCHKTKVPSAAGIERMMELLIMIPPVSAKLSQLEFSRAPSVLIHGISPKKDATSIKQNKQETSRRQNEQDDDIEEEEEEDDDDDEDDDESEDENQTTNNLPSYLIKKRYVNMMTKAWLSLLRLRPMSEYIMKQSLLYLPKYILPVTFTPLRFADFFHHAYGSITTGNSSSSNNNSNTTSRHNHPTANTGSTTVIPILALEGLFYLMIEHGLEYTNYYKQLYRLLHTSSIYYIKYRITFLKLLYNSIMKNDTLPPHIIAAFTKRLLRQALYASPSTIMFLLTFVSNILRKHPEISCLIHRNGSVDTAANIGSKQNATAEMEDPYNAVTDDPELCNALQSSLWELNALQHHYYGGVVTLAKSIGTENYKQTIPYDCTGEFLTITYTTIFEQERSRNKKPARGKNGGAPSSSDNINNNKRRRTNDDETIGASNQKYHSSSTPLAFHAPTTLFTGTDIFSTILSVPNVEK